MPGNWQARWATREPGVWGAVDRGTKTLNDEPWYGLSYGPIYFYMASSEHPIGPGSAQHAHMEAALKAVNRSETPWVVVTLHRMLYCSQTSEGLNSDSDIQGLLRRGVEPLLLKYDVDMVWVGHHHSFQRTCRVANGTCLGSSSDQHVRAPIHITMGTGGTGLSQNLLSPPPQWLEYANAQHWGYCRWPWAVKSLSADLHRHVLNHIYNRIHI